MQRTEHYNLSKPERTDPFRAQDVADNLDAIDEAIHNAAESGTASVDGMDIKPASVTATGDVADSHGTLDAVRQAAKDASNITSGTLAVARGGTGASTAAAARTNLGVTAANVVNGNAITPASVAATGAVSGSSVSDSVGSLADLRSSVSRLFDFGMNDTRLWATFYVTADRNNAIQLVYDRGTDKYIITSKLSGAWGSSRTIG